MTTLIKRLPNLRRLQIEHLLMGIGLAIVLLLAASRKGSVNVELSELDMRMAGLCAGFLVLAGVMRKAWRQRESRQWIWFVYGAIAMVGLQLFARCFMERFSDLYLSVWLELFKIGLI